MKIPVPQSRKRDYPETVGIGRTRSPRPAASPSLLPTPVRRPSRLSVDVWRAGKVPVTTSLEDTRRSRPSPRARRRPPKTRRPLRLSANSLDAREAIEGVRYPHLIVHLPAHVQVFFVDGPGPLVVPAKKSGPPKGVEVSIPTLAAASSRARGMPSSLLQRRASAGASSSPTTYSEDARKTGGPPPSC